MRTICSMTAMPPTGVLAAPTLALTSRGGFSGHRHRRR
jgi:hypothetical protein